jgi:hypothetical protein
LQVSALGCAGTGKSQRPHSLAWCSNKRGELLQRQGERRLNLRLAVLLKAVLKESLRLRERTAV